MTNSSNTFDRRRTLEDDFVGMAVPAVCGKHVDPAALFDICPPECVKFPRNKALYCAMHQLAAAGREITLPAIWTEITEGQAKGKDMYAVQLTADELIAHEFSIFSTSADFIINRARKVANEYAKVKAEQSLQNVIAQCLEYDSDPAQIADALKVIADAVGTGGEVLPADLSGLMQRVVQSAVDGERNAPMPTPWPNLNRILKGGFVAGELVVLAARPAMGKTALAGCIAVEAARSGKPVLFVSLEVLDLTLGQRLAAREGNFDVSVFRRNAARAEKLLPAVQNAAASLSDLPLTVAERSTAPVTPAEVQRKARSIKNIGLVIVDYLQLLTPTTNHKMREREVAEMSRAMKQLALSLKCPVLLLSQLNRAVETTERQPQLSDLRESGAIEQDADVVIFLHAKKEDTPAATVPIRAIVAKGRSSGTGAASLMFDKPHCNFTEDERADRWAETERGLNRSRQDNGL